MADTAPTTQTLLEELQSIDTRLLDGTAAEDDENRGRELVELLNSASHLQAQIADLTKKLEMERSYRKEMERDARWARRELINYKSLRNIYISLKQAAEAEAQQPIDEHYRATLAILEAIASDESACTCNFRGWHGEGHDTQCPIRLATDGHPLLGPQIGGKP